MAATLTEFIIESEHQTQDLVIALDNMRRKGKLCDVTLVVGDVEILAHRNVLASCSRYFYSMFINTVDATQERIELDGDPQTFLSVVNYMYTSKLTVHEDNLKNLLDIADMLLMDNLLNKCCKLLEHVTNPSNCLKIKTFANAYRNSALLASTLDYIDANFVDVVASEGFLNLTNNELVKLISRDTLKVPSEEKVYECVVSWIDHDNKRRRKYLRSLMECIRLQFISKAYLKQQIVNGPFLRGDAYCKDLIINALLDDDPTSTLEQKSRQYSRKILLVMGGQAEAKQSLEYFDFTTRNWSKVTKIPFGISVVCSVVANRKVYVLTSKFRGRKYVNSVYLYDIGTNNWCKINSMKGDRSAFCVAMLNNCIYLVGGSTSGFDLNSVEKFNLDTEEWISIAPMFTERSSLGVCVLNDKLYAIGGCNDDEILNTVECYDYHTNSWKKLCSMNVARYGAGVCALDGKIYAIGGHDGVTFFQSVEVYDPEVDSWTEISQINVPRTCNAVAVINNRIYIVGGSTLNFRSLNSVEVYDKESDSWTIMPEVMSVARWWNSVVVIDKTK